MGVLAPDRGGACPIRSVIPVRRGSASEENKAVSSSAARKRQRAEIGGADGVAGGELGRRAGGGDAAPAQHIGPRGEGEGEAGVLLDEQHRYTLPGDIG